MKNKDPEILVAYMNGPFLVKFVLYAIALVGVSAGPLYFASDANFKIVVFFVLWAACGGAAAAAIIMLSGLRTPGYGAATAAFSSDKSEKARMRSKYNAIKATKPCNLSWKNIIISAGAGLVLAAALASTL